MIYWAAWAAAVDRNDDGDTDDPGEAAATDDNDKHDVRWCR